MSKYTAEQVEAEADCLPDAYEDQAAKLRDYAALLRERESAKAVVTDEIIWKAARALFNARKNNFPIGTGAERRWNRDKSMYFLDAQYALEAVAPMLASARVPEREALEAIKRLPARPFPDPIAHSWEAFGRAVMGAFTDAKFIAIRALAAAPKPETEE